MEIFNDTIAADASVELDAADGLPESGTLRVTTDAPIALSAQLADDGEWVQIYKFSASATEDVPFAGVALRITAGAAAADVRVNVL